MNDTDDIQKSNFNHFLKDLDKKLCELSEFNQDGDSHDQAQILKKINHQDFTKAYEIIVLKTIDGGSLKENE